LGFHYNAILAPIMAYGAIESVKRYFKGKEMAAISLLIAGVLISQFRAKSDLYKMFKSSYYDLTASDNAKEVLKLIPDAASVSATNDLGAQIAHREKLYFLANCIEKSDAYGSDGRRCYPDAPDFIVANMDPAKWNNYYPDYDRESLFRYFDYLQNTKEYKLIDQKGDVYFFRRI